jgi:hypothetical protein
MTNPRDPDRSRRFREERRPAIRRDEREDRIGRQRRIVLEIDAGVDLAQQAPRQDADIEVRRLLDTVRPDDAGLDRLELTRAVRLRSAGGRSL